MTGEAQAALKQIKTAYLEKKNWTMDFEFMSPVPLQFAIRLVYEKLLYSDLSTKDLEISSQHTLRKHGMVDTIFQK